MSAEGLEAAFAHCRETTRTRARNFYYGLRLTPEPRRSAIFAIYAWMRAADDIADGAGAGAGTALREFRGVTESILRGDHGSIRSDREPMWTAFGATVRSYQLDAAMFSDMLDGLAWDLSTPICATEADLYRYCYRVASTVGLLCVAIWGLAEGADPVRAAELSIRRGQAFQRTNILRDFAEDFDSVPRRVYVPHEALQRHGVSADDLRSWRDPARCAAAIGEQAKLAREHYQASEPLIGMVDPACAPTLWAMTRIYSGILERIERNPEAVVAPVRVRLSSARKASIALAASLRARWAQR